MADAQASLKLISEIATLVSSAKRTARDGSQRVLALCQGATARLHEAGFRQQFITRGGVSSVLGLLAALSAEGASEGVLSSIVQCLCSICPEPFGAGERLRSPLPRGHRAPPDAERLPAACSVCRQARPAGLQRPPAAAARAQAAWRGVRIAVRGLVHRHPQCRHGARRQGGSPGRGGAGRGAGQPGNAPDQRRGAAAGKRAAPASQPHPPGC